MIIRNKREDITSRVRYDKSELARILFLERSVIYDPTYKMSGRGVYVHKDMASLAMLKKKRLLNRFAPSLKDEDYDRLIKTIAEANGLR